MIEFYFEDQYDDLIRCETNRRAFVSHSQVYETCCQSIFERLMTRNVVADDCHGNKKQLYEQLDGETRTNYWNQFVRTSRQRNFVCKFNVWTSSFDNTTNIDCDSNIWKSDWRKSKPFFIRCRLQFHSKNESIDWIFTKSWNRNSSWWMPNGFICVTNWLFSI